jgi:uncharacterized protein (TIGR04255 family)
MQKPFEILPKEQFDHLPSAPIREAILELRARAMAGWDQSAVGALLADKLTDYPSQETARDVKAQIHFPPGTSPPESKFEDVGAGFRCASEDNLQIGHFLYNRFAFNRLSPYQNWDTFQMEALRLWEIYTDFAKPVEIQRVGLRFVNQVEFSSEGKLDDFFTNAPENLPGLDLPVSQFLSQKIVKIPGHDYIVRVVRTVKPPVSPPDAPMLVLDIDVSKESPVELSQAKLVETLAEMRWIKNRVFFGSFTSSVLESFKQE